MSTTKTKDPTLAADKTTFRLVLRISERAAIELPGLGGTPLELAMDLTAVHLNGCPLNLNELLAFDKFNFAHDIYGIRRHIDRSTGSLGGCFLPRCARRDGRRS